MPSARANPDRSPIAQSFAELGWHGAAEAVDDILAHATGKRRTPREVLDALVARERLERTQRSLDRRQRRSRIGPFKPWADFDASWPERLDPVAVHRALSLRFFQDGANPIIVGPHGVGKTMLLKNIAHQAVLAGHSVVVISAGKLLGELTATDSPSVRKRRLQYYVGIGLLCLDELGYLAYDDAAADLLFEIITRRHESQKPIVLTTNLAFKDWPQIFPNATCTIALVDRLTHRADILAIHGESWRRKESAERADRLANDP